MLHIIRRLATFRLNTFLIFLINETWIRSLIIKSWSPRSKYSGRCIRDFFIDLHTHYLQNNGVIISISCNWRKGTNQQMFLFWKSIHSQSTEDLFSYNIYNIFFNFRFSFQLTDLFVKRLFCDCLAEKLKFNGIWTFFLLSLSALFALILCFKCRTIVCKELFIINWTSENLCCSSMLWFLTIKLVVHFHYC